MSASPAAPSPAGTDAATPGSQNGSTNGQPRYIRRPPPGDPLGMNKRKPVSAGPPRSARVFPPKPTWIAPGIAPIKPIRNIPTYQAQGLLDDNGPPPPTTTFSVLAQGPYVDFPLVTTKRALKEGLRHHILRFQAKRTVDPRDQEQFIRPVSLHRRDPRALPTDRTAKVEEPMNHMDDKEREKQEIAKALKDEQRAADLALIAPHGNNAAATATKKNKAFRNEKTTQVYKQNRTEADVKRSDLRYEESLPWHLEDAENKQTWSGTYESALSETNVILIHEDGKFRMVPIEKWYKFSAKNQFKTFTIEEAEAQMAKASKASRWAQRGENDVRADKELAESKRMLSVFGVKKESATFKNADKGVKEEADDLDFDDDDLFQDDDDNPNFEKDNDEEIKRDQDRVKKEQRGANLFGDGDADKVEKDLQKAKKEREQRQKMGKSTKKALKKREKNYLYESDDADSDKSDGGYLTSESSDSDTSEDDKQKEQDRLKDEAAKLKAKQAASASGSSTKGSNTPSGRPKHSDPLKKSGHLKRPGSPNLSASEASGNESSRKKHKKKHDSLASGVASALARPNSPSRKITMRMPINGNASPTHPTSDTEMSDSGAPRKNKISIRIGGTSAQGSRAGSRAGSPGPTGPATSALAELTKEDLYAAMPADGIGLTELGKIMKEGRVGFDTKQFLSLVKLYCHIKRVGDGDRAKQSFLTLKEPRP